MRLALVPGWIALVATMLLSIGIRGELSLSVQLVPLFASVVLLGLPHGAVDHLVVPRARGDRLTVGTMLRVAGVYAGLGGAYTVLWVVNPSVAFVGFVLLTWAHWGQGDLHPLCELVGADHVRGVDGAALTALVRGGAPMLVPLVAFPAEYERVAGWIVGVVDPASVASLDPFFAPETRTLIGAGYGLVVVAALGVGWVRSTDRRGWRIDVAETALLIAFFLTVPPVLAIGVYFCVWHSLRHVVRYLLLDGDVAAALSDGAVVTPLSRFARDAFPLTALAILLGVGFAVVLPAAGTDVTDLFGAYLVFIAVLTLPHVAFVSLLDRYDGLWRR